MKTIRYFIYNTTNKKKNILKNVFLRRNEREREREREKKKGVASEKWRRG